MQITINTKMIERVLSRAYDQTILGEYDKSIRKAAAVMGKKDFVSQTISDPKFQADLVKYLTKYLHDEDFLQDIVYDVETKLLDQMIDDCEAALDAEFMKEAEDMEDREIRYMVDSLKAAGYKVEKAV